MAERANRADVRNPLLGLPAMQSLRTMPDKHLLVALLHDIQRDARERAEHCWRRHKAPMAVYWKAVGVYAGHLARALNHG